MAVSSAWFVVLNQSSMKLFSRKNYRSPLKHFKTLRNTLARLKGKELARHKPGSVPKGDAVSGRTVLNGSKDLVARDFARSAAGFLDKQRKREQFTELHIAAEPRFLGLFRKSLPDETKKLVRGWVRKDLEKANVEKLAKAFA